MYCIFPSIKKEIFFPNSSYDNCDGRGEGSRVTMLNIVFIDISLKNEDHETGVPYIQTKTIYIVHSVLCTVKILNFPLTAPCNKCDRPCCITAPFYIWYVGVSYWQSYLGDKRKSQEILETHVIFIYQHLIWWKEFDNNENQAVY